MKHVQLPIDINPSNRCFSDYQTFITMHPQELSHMKNSYFQELKTLQQELELLLSDLKKSKLYQPRCTEPQPKFKQAV